MTTAELLDLTRKWERGGIGDEEYVRTIWARRRWPEWFQDKVDVCNGILEIPRSNGKPKWHAAAEFTRDRIEKVRQLEGEITYLIFRVIRPEVSHIQSIVQRLTALLAEARKGMR